MTLPLFSTSTVPSSKRRISGGGCSLGLVEACPLASEDVASVELASIKEEMDVGGGGPPGNLRI